MELWCGYCSQEKVYAGRTESGAWRGACSDWISPKTFRPLTNFRRWSGDFMKQLTKSRRPVVPTLNGKRAATVQRPRRSRGRDLSQAGGCKERQGAANEGVLRFVRSQAWYISLPSPPTLNVILQVSAGKKPPNIRGAARQWFLGDEESHPEQGAAAEPLRSNS
jgi:hypothetical protein